MKLFTKLKEDNSFKADDLKKSKKISEKKSKKEWLLSDDQFSSILHSSTKDQETDKSKLREMLLREETEK